MKVTVLKQSAKILELDSPTKKIEQCARVCYQSFEQEGEDTDIKLFKHLVQRGHTAMLEHYRVYFMTNSPKFDSLTKIEFIDAFWLGVNRCYSLNLRTLFELLHHNKQHYSKLAGSILLSLIEKHPKIDDVIEESFYRYPEKVDVMNSSDVPIAHRYITFDIMTNRGITHELVRHRKASFAQESTRYCAYRDELRVVLPETDDEFALKWILSQAQMAATTYSHLLNHDVPPQIARDILPNCTAAQIMMTMRYDWWQYFLSLRDSGKAHPTVVALAQMIRGELLELASTNRIQER